MNSAIRQASVKHSAGYDDIPCSLLSDVADVLTEPLTALFNACIAEKISKVLPIHKKGDPMEMTNYRPIEVPSVFSKIFEKILNCDTSISIASLARVNLVSCVVNRLPTPCTEL